MPDNAKKATLIYDAQCPICCRSADWAIKNAVRGELEILPCQSAARAERFPQVSREACMAAVQIVLPDGRVFSGADALPVVVWLMKGWWWLAPALRAPGVSHAMPYIYTWISKNRHELSTIIGGTTAHDCPTCDEESCERRGHDQPE